MKTERDSLSVAPGSSPPVVPPSVAAAPQSCHDAPLPERSERKQVESDSHVATLIQMSTKGEILLTESIIGYVPVHMSLACFLRSIIVILPQKPPCPNTSNETSAISEVSLKGRRCECNALLFGMSENGVYRNN